MVARVTTLINQGDFLAVRIATASESASANAALQAWEAGMEEADEVTVEMMKLLGM